jgi:hypothetical protein
VKLTLDDIVDQRAYERERDSFRDRIISVKRRRRVAVGPIVTLLFENRDTVRFQVQEMARAERMLSDDAILGELEVYNPLIPGPGELSATLFIELTSEPALREWLPKLVGIENAVEIRIGGTTRVVSMAEESHGALLSREDITASVHYLRWSFTPEEVDLFAVMPVDVAVVHPAYAHTTRLGPETSAELLADLHGIS